MKVATVFDEEIDHPGGSLYASALSNSLRRIFSDTLDDEIAFENLLPFFKWSLSEEKLSLFFISKHKFNLTKIFYDMINQWLMPGERINISFFFGVDFNLSSSQLYTLSEMVVGLPQDVDIDTLKYNLSVIETEIRLGMVSFYHTNRILEIGGLEAREKHARIQEKIIALIQKKPDEIDYDIFGEMQHFFVMSQDEFKAARETHYLSRLIALFYLFRKSIYHSFQKELEQRHIRLKIHPVKLHLPWGVKKVLGICVALNFLKPDELFEERHLIKALKNAIFYAKPVKDSFFVNEGGDERIHTLYIEIEKEDGLEFSQEEIQTLRLSFPEKLKGSIEVALKPLFMPRNEEEVIRHIVTLAKELRFIKDLPQVILSFEGQYEAELSYTIILVRTLFSHSLPIETYFEHIPTILSFIPDRTKRLGMLRKKYPKEATVFRVRLPSEKYIRSDGFLDLFKARQDVIYELQKVIGEVRDYNGGMISKQIELLSHLKNSLTPTDELLIDTLFHSLFPIEMRSILPLAQIQILFYLWKELLEHPEQDKLVRVENNTIYFIGRKEISLAESEDLLIATPVYRGARFFGGIYFYKTEEEKREFLSIPL